MEALGARVGTGFEITTDRSDNFVPSLQPIFDSDHYVRLRSELFPGKAGQVKIRLLTQYGKHPWTMSHYKHVCLDWCKAQTIETWEIMTPAENFTPNDWSVEIVTKGPTAPSFTTRVRRLFRFSGNSAAEA